MCLILEVLQCILCRIAATSPGPMSWPRGWVQWDYSHFAIKKQLFELRVIRGIRRVNLECWFQPIQIQSPQRLSLLSTNGRQFNTLKPGDNDQDFDSNFKCILFDKSDVILNKFARNVFWRVQLTITQQQFKVMTLCHQTPSLLTHICIARPLCVNHETNPTDISWDWLIWKMVSDLWKSIQNNSQAKRIFRKHIYICSEHHLCWCSDTITHLNRARCTDGHVWV